MGDLRRSSRCYLICGSICARITTGSSGEPSTGWTRVLDGLNIDGLGSVLREPPCTEGSGLAPRGAVSDLGMETAATDTGDADEYDSVKAGGGDGCDAWLVTGVEGWGRMGGTGAMVGVL